MNSGTLDIAVDWVILPGAILVAVGVLALIAAIINERRMQRLRQPGVTYGQVTFRRDGAWRNRALFTDEGLVYQARAAKWGMIGVAAVVIGIILAALTRIP